MRNKRQEFREFYGVYPLEEGRLPAAFEFMAGKGIIPGLARYRVEVKRQRLLEAADASFQRLEKVCNGAYMKLIDRDFDFNGYIGGIYGGHR